MKFELTPEDHQKINTWLTEVVYPPIVEQQLKNPEIAKMLFPDEDGKIRYPYTGAIGGGLTYSFSPTSLGMVIKVQYFNGQELDLTDYDSW